MTVWKRRFAITPAAEALAASLERTPLPRRGRAARDLGEHLAERRDAAQLAGWVVLLAQEHTAPLAAEAILACGERAPDLLLAHSDTFFELLHWPQGKQIVCNAMRALFCLARHSPERIWLRRDEILQAYENGSQRTREAAVRLLAELARATPDRGHHLSPMLATTLDECTPTQLCRWGAWIMPALCARESRRARRTLARRRPELAPSHRVRLDRLLGQAASPR